MKVSRFTDAQKALIISQGDGGKPIAEVCREAGISQATYSNQPNPLRIIGAQASCEHLFLVQLRQE